MVGARVGMVPNGLLPNASARVTRRLDPERWAVAEDRTAELITRIQPNAHSEGRRLAVYHYVQRLIMNCLSCQVQYLVTNWSDCSPQVVIGNSVCLK